ncbi:MAG: DNA-binding response regulator [Spirochaetae bacterium HGW-Spirochaetae-5]|nr:MAG: DNA-binding response regulator [Spirochaetae bacterium HGW-Spirochaetae-5]
MNKIRVFIADDHAIMRDGLKLIISQDDRYELAGEAGDGLSALEGIEKLKPEIAILDISMPVMTGLDVARQLKKYNTGIKIILLSRHDNEAYVNQALQNNINGYVLKDYAGIELMRAMSDVMMGDIYLSPKLINKLACRMNILNSNALHNIDNEELVISNREKQVLKLICESKTNKSIALNLRISEQTVKAHRKNIMKKLGIHNVTDLLKYAIKIGLIEV